MTARTRLALLSSRLRSPSKIAGLLGNQSGHSDPIQFSCAPQPTKEVAHGVAVIVTSTLDSGGQLRRCGTNRGQGARGNGVRQRAVRWHKFRPASYRPPAAIIMCQNDAAAN